MPRTVQEIIDQAADLAKRFESDDFGPGRSANGASLRAVRQAFRRRALAEEELTAAVTVAKAEGHSWAMIGSMVGTTGEAARQKYGTT